MRLLVMNMPLNLPLQVSALSYQKMVLSSDTYIYNISGQRSRYGDWLRQGSAKFFGYYPKIYLCTTILAPRPESEKKRTNCF
jgi:hypothetical protein